MGEKLGCKRCGHVAEIEPGPDGKPPEPVSQAWYRCKVCGALVTFGVLMPRLLITPHPQDKRFIVLQFDALAIPLARQFARQFALDLLSACPQSQHAPASSIVRPTLDDVAKLTQGGSITADLDEDG